MQPTRELIRPLTQSHLPDVYAKGSLRFRKIPLDTALAGLEVNLQGVAGGADFVFFDENSTLNTGATMTIDDESSPAKLPIGPLRGFRDLPCKRIFLTCGAIAGGALNLWYGKGTYIYGQTPQGKGQWYDRAPLNIIKTYNAGGIAPHADTQRWTYTVPANRKATIEACVLELFRVTAAGAAAEIDLRIVVNGNNYMIVRFQGTNAVGDRIEQVLGQGGILLAGDIIEGHTLDQSTTGTISYCVSAKLTEFDA